MRKVFILLVALSCANAYSLPTENPFTGDYQNQISLGIGQGFDTGWIVPQPVRPVPFYIGSIAYSQPTTFFRIPARRSINVSGTLGLNEKYGWKWQDYSIPIVHLSEDIALLKYKHLYFAVGAGVGLQAQQNERIDSKLLFQLKLTFGYKFTPKLSTELFVQHFSNANTGENNYSYAFYGIGFTHNY